jgi:hypothetical protein
MIATINTVGITVSGVRVSPLYKTALLQLQYTTDGQQSVWLEEKTVCDGEFFTKRLKLSQSNRLSDDLSFPIQFTKLTDLYRYTSIACISSEHLQ